jgi:hypothetical protein
LGRRFRAFGVEGVEEVELVSRRLRGLILAAVFFQLLNVINVYIVFFSDLLHG